MLERLKVDHNPHSSLCHTDNDPQNLKQPCHNSPSHTTVVVILVPVSSSNWESNYFSLSVLTEPQNNMTQLHTLNAQFKLWLVVHFVYVHLSNELVGWELPIAELSHVAGGQDRLGKHLTIPSLQLQLGKSTEPALLVMVQRHVINIKMSVKCTRARSLKMCCFHLW